MVARNKKPRKRGVFFKQNLNSEGGKVLRVRPQMTRASFEEQSSRAEGREG